jgi:DNA repair exonuclease SbcCD nuclease subunit
MKIAIITDLHFGTRADSAIVADHQRRFYHEVLFPYIDKHKIKRLMCLGDTFDRRKYSSHLTLAKSNDALFEEAAKRELQFDMLVGNHDIFYRSTNKVNTPELVLGQYKNITIYTDPTEIEVGGTKILMMPWINPENYEDCMTMIRDTKAHVMFGHLELAGFEMYKGSVVAQGMSHSMFSKFEMVCSGHYHHKSSSDNIHYLGSPYEMTWSDYNDDRGFHVFDTKTRSLEYIKNLLHLFQHHVYDDTDKTMADVLSEVDNDRLRNCYVKLLVKNKTNPFWFDMVVERIEKNGVADLKISEDSTQLGVDLDETLDSTETTISIIQKYAAASVQDAMVLQELNNLLQELYTEAQSLESTAE